MWLSLFIRARVRMCVCASLVALVKGGLLGGKAARSASKKSDKNGIVEKKGGWRQWRGLALTFSPLRH